MMRLCFVYNRSEVCYVANIPESKRPADHDNGFTSFCNKQKQKPDNDFRNTSLIKSVSIQLKLNSFILLPHIFHQIMFQPVANLFKKWFMFETFHTTNYMLSENLTLQLKDSKKKKHHVFPFQLRLDAGSNTHFRQMPLFCFTTVPPEITASTTQINKWGGTDSTREMDGGGKRCQERNGRKKRGIEGSREG